MAGRARAERSTLADLLAEVGPAHPTLCAGWTTHDLAAHLVTRERVPKAAPGLLIPKLHGVTERAERATMRAHSFPELVDIFRSGPPWWHPSRVRLVDDAANLIEFFIHTEDVRRAGSDVPPPRQVDAAARGAMWTSLRIVGFGAFRRVGVGVVAERIDAPGRLTLRRGEPTVVLVGPPEELLLYAYGRRSAARVDFVGDDAAVKALRSAHVGL